MQDLHDDRRVPLEFEPAATPSERSFWVTFIDRFLARRNRQDEARVRAVEANERDRVADAKRQSRQPGLSRPKTDMAMRVFGRVGGGK